MTGPSRWPCISSLALTAALAAAPGISEQPIAPGCSEPALTGSIEVGDGSAPPCEFIDLWAVPESGNWLALGNFRWGAIQAALPAGTWRLAAHACETYFPFRPSDPVICTAGPDNCVHCDPPFTLKMFAVYGGFSGQVTSLPSGQPAGPGVPVSATSGLSCTSEKFTHTDPDGRFALVPEIEPHRSNHWGAPVDGDGSGPGSRSYYLTADYCENGVTATTYSSADVTVNLYRVAPYMAQNDPSTRPLRFTPLLPVPPPQEVGRGISVTTGNVFLDQVDAAAWGAPGSLSFARSYNSRAAAAKIEGVLGPGWSHTYSARVSTPEPRVVMLRDDDGAVLYFQDADGDHDYRASVPLAERSRVVKVGNTFERRFPEGGRDVFSASGPLIQRIDATGRTTRLTRDPAGVLTSVQDADGRRLALSYAPNGRLAKVSAGSEVIVTYAYDATERLQQAKYGDGTGFVFTYDDAGQILSMADLAGRTLRSYRYADNKARTFETANGQDHLRIDYGPLRTTVVDATGHVGTYEWTNVHGVHLVTAVSGFCTSCRGFPDPVDPAVPTPALPIPLRPVLDARPAWAKQLDPPWPLREWPAPAAVDWTAAPTGVPERRTWTYDPDGRLLSYREPSGRTISVAYNEQGDPATLSFEPGGRIRFGRDAAGRVTSVRTPSALAPQLERSTILSYDEKGRLISRTETGIGPEAQPLRLTTRIFYDEAGRVTRVESPRTGADVSFTYDATGNLLGTSDAIGAVKTFAGHTALGYPTSVTELGRTTIYTYDPRGRVLSMTDSGEMTRFGYNVNGRVREIVRPGGDPQQYDYDSGDRLIEERLATRRLIHRYDPSGQHRSDEWIGERGVERQRSLDYDMLGRLRSLSVGGASLFELGYDGDGRVQSIKGPGTEATSVQYDDGGRISSLRRVGVASLTYRHDSAGRILSVTDGQNGAYTYLYDDLGRLRRQAGPGVGTTAFDYDGNGNVVSRTDGRGIATAFEYDLRGRLLHVRFPKDHAIDYTYDDCPSGQGRLCSAVDGAGKTTFAYESHGHVSQETREAGGLRHQTSYSYDAEGNVSGVRYPSGQLVAYSWDGTKELRSVSVSGARGIMRVLANLSRTADGLLSGISYSNGVATTWTRDGEGRVRSIRGGLLDLGYAYDPQGNVASLTSVNGNQSFEYGPGHRLTVANGPWGGITWSYDSAGDRLTESTRTNNTSYSYQPRTQLLLSATAESTTAFGYDGAGRTTKIGENRYNFDEAGRLAWVGSDVRNVEFAYDYKGRRVSKTTRDGTITFHYDAQDRLIAESSPEGWIDYIYADDRPIGVVKGSLYYLLGDVSGAPLLAADAQARTAWERRPRPFGDDAPSETSTIPLNLRASGQYYDRETGFVYSGRRTYMPRFGRYLEPSPCVAPADLPTDSAYGYASANPLSFASPQGVGTQPIEASRSAAGALWRRLLPLPVVVSPECETTPKAR